MVKVIEESPAKTTKFSLAFIITCCVPRKITYLRQDFISKIMKSILKSDIYNMHNHNCPGNVSSQA